MASLDAILRFVRPASDGDAATPAPADVEACSAAIAALVEERSQAEAELGAAIEQREMRLLEPNSNAAIADLDRRIDELTLVRERCDAAQPLATARLFAAYDDSRRAALEDLREAYRNTVHLFCEATRLAHRHRALLVKINDTAQQLGYRSEAQLLLAPPHVQIMVSPASISTFESDATLL